MESAYQGTYDYSTDAVVSFSRSGTSLAEELTSGLLLLEGEKQVWDDFIRWLDNK